MPLTYSFFTLYYKKLIIHNSLHFIYTKQIPLILPQYLAKQIILKYNVNIKRLEVYEIGLLSSETTSIQDIQM